jgi:predicted dehydrogenase
VAGLKRAAIVGCGKIADQHVHAIQRIPTSRVVAVCDREPLMARQLAERLTIPAWFSDVREMLNVSAPDIVHVTTPPQSHYTIGRQCLDAGCHVYLEKPFTVTAAEAEDLIALARTRALRVTAGHNYQFTPEMLEMRRLVREGFLGGRPLHVESYWSYDLGDTSYVGPLLGNSDHWVRQLPGQLLHNIISHGIARLAEFLDDEIDFLAVSAHQSKQLRRMGGQTLLDELRVLVRDGSGTTATFSFSTQMKPGLNKLRLCGPTRSLTVDLSSGGIIRHESRSYKSYLTFMVPPLISAREHLRNFRRNFAAIVRQRLYQDSGMKELIGQFHESTTGGAPPLTEKEILLTARLMDAIFERLPGAVDSTPVMADAHA